MANIGRTAVALRILGEDLDPDEISRLLGGAPSTALRKGDLRQSPSGDVVQRVGMWRLRCEDRSPGDLDCQIQDILARLTDDLDVWRDIARRYRCDVFCGVFMEAGNEGATLDSTTLDLLSDRGLRLALDIYGPEAGSRAPTTFPP